MNLCNNRHDVICYEAESCPCCEMFNQISDFEDTIYDLKEEINYLKGLVG